MSQMVPWMLWGTLRSYFHPCLWAPTTHGWQNIHCLISAFRGHSPLSPSPAIEHHTGSRGIPAWVPAPPSQEVGFFFSSVSPHPLLAGRASITTVRLEVIEAGDEERAHILSIEKQDKKKKKKKRSKDKHPVELREVNSKREPRFPPFPGVSIIPLRFNMHSDYFTK